MRFTKTRAYLLAALVSVSFGASAALPESVSTAITGAGTDTLTAVGLMIGVSVGIWGLRKVLNLFGR